MTSVVAYTLIRAGYFLGNDIGPHNWENKDLHKIMLRRKLFIPAPEGMGLRRRTVNLACSMPGMMRRKLLARGLGRFLGDRNASHARRGFKIRHASEYTAELCALLRNPVPVICIRNPIATCQSIRRRNPEFPDPMRRLEATMIAVDAMRKLHALNLPFIAVEMDAVRRNPDKFVGESCDLLKLEADREDIVRKISRPGYKTVPAGMVA
ncbi:hypothetical protein [Mangrovicoccus ximenensis]|uniref:hypothetical protein n=1 Tax=Mangrovicoccus ximenensis TaxID=1911570 RepID=UPI000D374BAE|nr:hypothetical protein [Mangrovicoccus ximenensis]